MTNRFAKIGCLLITMLAWSSIAFAGPFGLEMGMTLKQIQKISDTKQGQAPYVYEAKKLPKNHKSFEKYYMTISSKNGLCKITAIGKDINTSSYGTEIVSSFETIEKNLTDKYGENKKYDFLKSESIWSKDNEWTMALKLKERTLAAFWTAKDGANLIENVKSIMLEASATNQHTGYYVVSYEFNNIDACREEVSSKEQESL
jgi:hypothetical protein